MLVLLAACRPKAAPIPDASPTLDAIASAPVDAGAAPELAFFADKPFPFWSVDDVKGTAIVTMKGGRCTIAADDTAKCVWYAKGEVPLEHEDGAKALVWMDGAIGGAAPVSAPTFHWGRAFANGRVMFVDGDGKLFEIEKGRAIATKHVFPLQQGSTRFVDGWVLWKDTRGEGDARVMAMNLADGANANAIQLGTTKRPGGIHRYDTCATDDRYVDMDPNLAVRSKGKWRMVAMEYPRRITCAGDHVILTTGDALRCDPAGCRPHAFSGIGPDGGFGLDLQLPGSRIEHRETSGTDDVQFILEHYDAMTLTILPNGDTYRTVALAPEKLLFTNDRSLYVVAGRALVIGRRLKDDKPVVLSIDRSGSVKSIVAAQ